MQPREASAADTPIPTSVFRVDVETLARLAGCSVSEMYHCFSQLDECSDIEGTLLDKGKQLVFGIEEDSPKTFQPPKTTTALISAAARPGVLDTAQVPKELIVLEGTNGLTVIELVLRALYRAGIERVYIVLGWAGAKIQEVLSESGLLDLLDIIYIDLGEHYNAGHARSLIKARRYLQDQQSFLLCTSDHIFDPRLIYELANCTVARSSRQESSALDLEAGTTTTDNVKAIVLVETDFEAMLDTLPGTAVKVRFREQDDVVEDIGRHVTEYNGIDAGLFLVTPDLFEVLIDLAAERPYFSLADALAHFAYDHELIALPTNGLEWASVETPGQLHETQELLEDGALRYVGPWDVRIVKVPMASMPASRSLTSLAHDTHALSDFARMQALLLGIPRTAGTHVHLIRDHIRAFDADGEDDSASRHLYGLVVPVQPIREFSSPTDRNTQRGKRKPKHQGRTGYLLRMSTRPSSPPLADREGGSEAGSRRARRSNSHFGEDMPELNLEDLHAADPFILSVPLRRTDVVDEVWNGDHALLFALPPSGADTSADTYQVLLALPKLVEEPEEPHTHEPQDEFSLIFGLGSAVDTAGALLPELPTDLEKIVLNSNVQTTSESRPKLHMVVIRNIPTVGWTLLAIGFVASCIGRILSSVQTDAASLLKAFWRQQCSALILSLCCFYRVLVRHLTADTAHESSYRHLRLAQSDQQAVGSRRFLALLIVLSGVGFAAQSDGDHIAVEHTSRGLYELFSTWTPLLVILYAAVVPTVRKTKRMEIAGACTGMLGAAIICIIDKQWRQGSHAGGNFAGIMSAVGSAVFLLSAKLVRKKIDILHFAFISQVISLVVTTVLVAGFLAISVNTNVYEGVFGWLYPGRGDRLWLQLGASFMADVVGLLAYLAVLIYVHPVLIAALMMLEPIAANFLAAMIGLEPLPTLTLLFGATIVFVGGALVIMASMGPQYQVKDACFALEREGESAPQDGVYGYHTDFGRGRSRHRVSNFNEGKGSRADSPSRSLQGVLSKLRLGSVLRSERADPTETTGLLAYAVAPPVDGRAGEETKARSPRK